VDADDEKPDRNKNKFESGFDTRATYRDQADDARARVRQPILRESRTVDPPKPVVAESSYIPTNLIERQIATKLSLLYADERKRYDQHVKAAVERYGDATPQYRLDVAKTLLQPVPEQQQDRQIAGHLRSEYSRQQKQQQQAFDAEQRALQASAHQQRAELAKRRSANQNLPFKLQPWQQQATAIKERLQRMLGRYAPLKAYAASPKRKRLPTRKKSSQVQPKSTEQAKAPKQRKSRAAPRSTHQPHSTTLVNEPSNPANASPAVEPHTVRSEPTWAHQVKPTPSKKYDMPDKATAAAKKVEAEKKGDLPGYAYHACVERISKGKTGKLAIPAHLREAEDKKTAAQEAAKGGRKLTDAEKINMPADTKAAIKPKDERRKESDKLIIAAMKQSRTQGRGGGRGGR
jgi:hypothetical protein